MRAVLSVVLACAALGQEPSPDAPVSGAPARLVEIDRYADGSCGAVLVDPGGRAPFHLALTRYRCDIYIGARHRGRQGARRLQPGGKEEAAFLARLLAWSTSSFDLEERQRIEAAEEVAQRDSDWTFDRYKQAAVLHRLAQYRRIRGAEITSVIPGRGTVALTFKVRDGLGKARLVMFRKLDGKPLRPHLGDAAQPVAEGGHDERWILQAMQSFAQKGTSETFRDAMWRDPERGLQELPADASRDAARVLAALIVYRTHTSPRLIQEFQLLDGGSTQFAFVDARGRAFEILFDGAHGSKTPGRIKYRAPGATKSELLGFGDPEEVSVLAQLDALLARSAPDERSSLRDLVARYRVLRKAAKR